MAKCIGVESLRGIRIVAEDDVYDLARLVLRVQVARDRARSVGQVVTTRGNVAGLAYTLADVSGLPRESVLRELEARGVPLDAMVVAEDEVERWRARP